MRLSTIFELLLIFLFLAFAASKSIHGKKGTKVSGKQTANRNRYCQCTNLLCNCCRDFSLPVVSLKGPGCASVAYLNDDAMRLTMTFGDKVLRNITLAGKRPNPVCMPLPGGVSKFCGRVYGITRDGDHFKACLALELRSLEDLEAALRVSCFRFGPEGVKLEPGRPVPVTPTDEDEDDDDDYGFSDEDDDDDDDFGLSDDDDDDEDDDDGGENDVDSGDTDYTGFSALSDEFLEGFFGGSSSSSKKKTKTTTKAPQPIKVTKKPIKASSTTLKATTPTTVETTKASQATTMETIQTTDIKSNQNLIMTSTEVNEQMTLNNSVTEVGDSSANNTVNVSDESSSEQDSEEEDEEEFDEDVSEEEDGDEGDEGTESSISIIDNSENAEENEHNNKESNNVHEISDKEIQGRRYEIQPEGRGENITPEETEKLFPGLTALIRPPSYTSYSFPPVRSARTHRRMRLPPLQS